MSEAPGASSEDNVPLPGFEGPEKVLEIDFTPGKGPSRGLRDIARAQWDSILTDARCTILATMSNEKMDSYVLSESSLFVYPLKLILKTCGTTTLLMCLPRLLEITGSLGMTVEWVAYTRKDFQFPHVQKFPHRDPMEEMSYLRTHFPEGSAFLMGPMTGDHWFVFVADYVDRPTTECVDRTLDMMMFGIDEDVAKLFWKDDARFPKHSDVTKASGIDTLLPGSSIQEFCFDPCGYSMNGLLYDSYWTIHITPESHCSYASFETNIRMANYDSLIKAVLAIFRPQKFTTTLFADEHGLRQMKSMPFPQLLPVPLVDSQHRAIMGPCVLLADGNVETMVVAAAAAATAAVETEEKKAAETRAGERASTGGSAGELAADATSTPGTPVTPVATATTGGAGGAGSGSKSRVPRRGAANYVCAHKSMSEFMGYSCFMGNYQLVHAAQSSSSRNSLEAVPQAAKEKLSMPRAKYIVAQEAENMRNRLRTESM